MTGVGLCLPQLGPHVDAATVRAFCSRAEELGYSSVWVQEHLFVPVDPISGYAGNSGRPIPLPYRSTLAATELLTAAAAWTSRVLVGTSVLVGGYHRPVELAQRLATIDVLSAGRLIVGLGVGWSTDEHAQSDTDMSVRGRRLEELVQALRSLWGSDPVSFDGQYFSVPPSHVSPKPIQARVPIIGGSVLPKGLERVARSMDGWNPAGLSVDKVAGIATRLNDTRTTPLSIWCRVFTQPPSGAPRSIDDLRSEVEAAREHGFAELIIDANFDETITSPADWASLPERLARLLQ